MKNKLSFLLAIALIALLHASGFAMNKVVIGTITDGTGLDCSNTNFTNYHELFVCEINFTKEKVIIPDPGDSE